MGHISPVNMTLREIWESGEDEGKMGMEGRMAGQETVQYIRPGAQGSNGTLSRD